MQGIITGLSQTLLNSRRTTPLTSMNPKTVLKHAIARTDNICVVEDNLNAVVNHSIWGIATKDSVELDSIRVSGKWGIQYQKRQSSARTSVRNRCSHRRASVRVSGPLKACAYTKRDDRGDTLCL